MAATHGAAAMTGTDASTADIEATVGRFVRARLGASARVEGLDRVSTGRSRENWVFDAVWTPSGHDTERRESLIARRDPLGGLIETSRATEFELLRALEGSTLPTPQVRWLDPDGSELGRPCLVMVRLPGRCEYYALGDDSPLDARVDLARRLCELLASVHAVDWSSLGLGELLGDPGADAPSAVLDEWEATLHRDQLQPWPQLDAAITWLRERAPQCDRIVLVHGDFKVGNVLLDDSGTSSDGAIVALLDWELAHLGDRHEDLGWVTQPLRRREHQIAGSWEPPQLLEHYERVSGIPVDHRSVRWWNVFSTFKTAVMQVSGLRAFTEGRSDQRYEPTERVLSTLAASIREEQP